MHVRLPALLTSQINIIHGQGLRQKPILLLLFLFIYLFYSHIYFSAPASVPPKQLLEFFGKHLLFRGQHIKPDHHSDFQHLAVSHRAQSRSIGFEQRRQRRFWRVERGRSCGNCYIHFTWRWCYLFRRLVHIKSNARVWCRRRMAW